MARSVYRAPGLSVSVPCAACAGSPGGADQTVTLLETGLVATTAWAGAPSGSIRRLIACIGMRQPRSAGRSGAAIVPGNAKGSLLYQLLLGAVQRNGEEIDAMPKVRKGAKFEPLPKVQIELIGKWIDQGANWP